MTNKEYEERLTLISQYEYVTPKEREDLIKQLILDLIGEDENENNPDETKYWIARTRNILRAELRQIVEGEKK